MNCLFAINNNLVFFFFRFETSISKENMTIGLVSLDSQRLYWNKNLIVLKFIVCQQLNQYILNNNYILCLLFVSLPLSRVCVHILTSHEYNWSTYHHYIYTVPVYFFNCIYNMVMSIKQTITCVTWRYQTENYTKDFVEPIYTSSV